MQYFYLRNIQKNTIEIIQTKQFLRRNNLQEISTKWGRHCQVQLIATIYLQN